MTLDVAKRKADDAWEAGQQQQQQQPPTKQRRMAAALGGRFGFKAPIAVGVATTALAGNQSDHETAEEVRAVWCG